MFSSLKKFVSRNEPVTIIYIGQDKQITERTILIKSVTTELVRAFCLKRQEIRTFRIDRILASLPARKARSYGKIS